MRISTLDPISMNDVNDIANAPYVIEGRGSNALKIYFKTKPINQSISIYPCIRLTLLCLRPMQ
ncbi:MAG: hypothetical protein KJO91_06010, partial [Gammaproteobacteria bacterium]|nr:hypothetical protein [Gammaproteobacteria bacterium]